MAAFAPVTMRRLRPQRHPRSSWAFAVETSSSDAGLLQFRSATGAGPLRPPAGRLPRRRRLQQKTTTSNGRPPRVSRCIAPPVKNKHKTDPFAPRDDDGPGVAAWRIRMASETARRVTSCVTSPNACMVACDRTIFTRSRCVALPRRKPSCCCTLSPTMSWQGHRLACKRRSRPAPRPEPAGAAPQTPSNHAWRPLRRPWHRRSLDSAGARTAAAKPAPPPLPTCAKPLTRDSFTSSQGEGRAPPIHFNVPRHQGEGSGLN